MYRYFKRTLDFVVALIMIIVLSPVMLVSGIFIKLQNDGPVLFTQERPGKDGKIFRVYKFRTMSVRTNDEQGRNLSDFQRTTKVGRFLRKTSIDELPQLFNIIKGEMSFIGPRPLLTEYLPFYSAEQMRRHEVTPGISGWAQVNGRNTLTWDEKFKLDVYYVDHFGLKLDIIIFFKTIFNVLKQDGINCDNSNTMEKFHETAIYTESSEVVHK